MHITCGVTERVAAEAVFAICTTHDIAHCTSAVTALYTHFELKTGPFPQHTVVFVGRHPDEAGQLPALTH